MIKFRKILSGLKYKLFGANYKVISGQLAGYPLQVIRGTLRPQVDKDDAWLYYLTGRFDRIFDIGANIGQTALFAKTQGIHKKILAVDANKEALTLAAKNLIINNFSIGCEFIPAFLSDRPDEEVTFYTVGAGAAGSMYRGHAETAAITGQSQLVPTTTIDTLISNGSWIPEFVKIDVEGAEAKVLNGSKELAQMHQTWFMVEMHSPPELPMTENAALVIDWAKSTGYTAWYMRDSKQLTDPSTLADRGRCHLLLLPKDTAYPVELSHIREGSELIRK